MLEGEYERLFLDPEGDMVSLVESTHKPWMTKGAGGTFDGSKGLLMGDRALHMSEMYRRYSIEVPEELRTTPDHLVAELEFLALLFRCAPEELQNSLSKIISTGLRGSKWRWRGLRPIRSIEMQWT